MVIIDRFPIWAVYLGTVALAVLAAEIGFLLGLWLRKRNLASAESAIRGAVVGGVLGLMAFLMAFSTGIVINQHSGRKAMVVTEANAVGTAWLRAGFLDEPDMSVSRDLLREYVEVRLAPQRDQALFESALARSEEIQAQLWSIVEENVRQGKESDIMALYADAINTVIDVHTLRLTSAERRLPSGLLAVLYLALVLSFLMLGVASSDDGKRIPPLTLFLFAMVFVTTMMLILDLNRPMSGLVTVSQAGLEDLLRSLTP